MRQRRGSQMRVEMPKHSAVSRSIRITLLLAAASIAVESRAADCAAPEKTAADMSESTYNDTQEAMELISKQKYAEAIDKLTKISEKGSDYEKAVVSYNLGFAYSSKNDTAGAVKAFAKALSYKALPRAQSEQ